MDTRSGRELYDKIRHRHDAARKRYRRLQEKPETVQAVLIAADPGIKAFLAYDSAQHSIGKAILHAASNEANIVISAFTTSSE